MSIKLSYHEVMGALLVLLTVATSCSNDDLATKTETKPTTDNTEAAQVNFVAGHDGTRTSLNYDSGAFFWEDGDRIYITIPFIPAAMPYQAAKCLTLSL